MPNAVLKKSKLTWRLAIRIGMHVRQNSSACRPSRSARWGVSFAINRKYCFLIVMRQVEELRKAGVPGKYLSELEKKKIG